MKIARAGWIVVGAVVLSGCAGMSGGRGYPSKFSPPDLFVKPIEDPDIIAALSNGGTSGKDLEGEAFKEAFDKALRGFTSTKPVDRNRIQDRLILASNELCENYKVLLKKKQARFNFWAGTAATVFGATGGVVTATDGARALAAASGIASGVRAEYNEQYYSDLAAHVITKGIDARRSEILIVINTARSQSNDVYTVELAIADAITYHGACSLIGGLEQADSTQAKFNGFVGLDALGANPFFKKITRRHPQSRRHRTDLTAITVFTWCAQGWPDAAVTLSHGADSGRGR